MPESQRDPSRTADLSTTLDEPKVAADSGAATAILTAIEEEFMSFKRPFCCSGVIPLEGALKDLGIWYEKSTGDHYGDTVLKYVPCTLRDGL